MIHKMTPMQRKAAALLLLALSLAMAILAVAWPLRMLHLHYDEALEQATDRLTRYSRISAMRGRIEEALQRTNASNPAKFFLKNASPSLAAAEIQDIAKNAIEASGGKLVSMQILPHKDEGKYRQVPINVQMSATLPGLKNMLSNLESARPVLFLDNVSIRSPLGYLPQTQPAGEPELFVQFDLSGYAMAGAAQP